MERTARALAGYGRHGDNNLLHVSDQELRGIELLSGKKFTRNPDTGLPEAFNWSSLIPIAAGIAGTAVGGPLGGALASGVASGGIAAAEGKSAQEALTKGLISGVTSYAGGELLAGVPDAAAKAATETAAQTASQTAAQGAAQSAAQAGSGVGSAVTVEPLGEITAAGISPAVGPTTTIPEVAGAGIPSTQVAPGLTVPAPSQEATFGEKISNIVSEPKASLSQISKNIKASPFNALIATGGTYAQAMDMLGPPKMPGEEPYDPSKYPEQFPVNPRTWNAPGAGYQPGYSPEYRYFAKGGLANLRKEDGVTANVMNEAKAALLGEHPRPSEALGRFRNMFGEDALDVLRDKVTGGRVRGAGGGMDDLVPGTIEGRQQVRLADSEFVIPADVVSGLGDGSTDQGVRRLHEMMRKVRQERTGKTTQPKSIGGKITL